MHVQNRMNSLWDICIFLGLVPKESDCIYVVRRQRVKLPSLSSSVALLPCRASAKGNLKVLHRPPHWSSMSSHSCHSSWRYSGPVLHTNLSPSCKREKKLEWRKKKRSMNLLIESGASCRFNPINLACTKVPCRFILCFKLRHSQTRRESPFSLILLIATCG